MNNLTDLEIEALLNRLEGETADDLESYHLDIKSWKDVGEARRAAIEYAACFANAGGGVIIFGINDKTRGRAKAIQGVERVNVDALCKGYLSRYTAFDPRQCAFGARIGGDRPITRG